MTIPLEIIKFLFAYLFVICKINLFAQQTILSNQAAYNLFTLNPASIGLSEESMAVCQFKKNWLGIIDSPELLRFSAAGPLNQHKYGLGLNLINEKTGLFSKTYLSGSFCYKIKLKDATYLSFGLTAGMQKQQIDFSKIKADSPDEFSQFPQQQNSVIPDAGVGILYSKRHFLLSFSSSQILRQSFSYSNSYYNKEINYQQNPQYIFFIQNTFSFGQTFLQYIPHLSIRSSQGFNLLYDLLNTLIYKKKVMLGIGFRNANTLYSNLGFIIHENLKMIYSYEYSNNYQSITKGGHEIGISFGLNRNKDKNLNTKDNRISSELTEVYEKLESQDQKLEILNKKVDSLDKNVSKLNSELEFLKSKQLSQSELKNIFDKLDSIENKSEFVPVKNIETRGKYKMLNQTYIEANELEDDSLLANYKIVLGVYQLLNYAKEFQKYLMREVNLETRLFQFEDHPKNYIYICEKLEYSSINKAIEQLKVTRNNMRLVNKGITNGEAWILRTKIK